MGIEDRRERERLQRRRDILDAAWKVADEVGWATFSVERVAAAAELGRATVYGYFESLESLVHEMAREALQDVADRLAAVPGLREALDIPVRFAQQRPAAFSLLFPPAPDPRAAFSTHELDEARVDARDLIGRLQRLASKAGASLPEDAQSAKAFIAGITMAGAVVPELRASTPLRRRWQDFALRLGGEVDEPTPPSSGDAKAGKQG